jgi:hypothetical protein
LLYIAFGAFLFLSRWPGSAPIRRDSLKYSLVPLERFIEHMLCVIAYKKPQFRHSGFSEVEEALKNKYNLKYMLRLKVSGPADTTGDI